MLDIILESAGGIIAIIMLTIVSVGAIVFLLQFMNNSVGKISLMSSNTDEENTKVAVQTPPYMPQIYPQTPQNTRMQEPQL